MTIQPTPLESGTARCPRCAAHARYQFLDGGAVLVYEVRCTGCGGEYREITYAEHAPAA